VNDEASTPDVGVEPGSIAATETPALDDPQRRHSRTLIFGVLGALVVIALVIGGVVIFNKANAALSAGSGTATITWTSTSGGASNSNPAQSFTGTIGGHPVSGVATFTTPTTINPTSRTQLLTPGYPFFHYKGSFSGKTYNLGVGISTAAEGFVITGTYDGKKVNAIVSAPANTSGNSETTSASFHGTIGEWKVTGTIQGPTGSGRTKTVTATYTVS
jgi:hypothetical protein